MSRCARGFGVAQITSSKRDIPARPRASTQRRRHGRAARFADCATGAPRAAAHPTSVRHRDSKRSIDRCVADCVESDQRFVGSGQSAASATRPHPASRVARPSGGVGSTLTVAPGTRRRMFADSGAQRRALPAASTRDVTSERSAARYDRGHCRVRQPASHSRARDTRACRRSYADNQIRT